MAKLPTVVSNIAPDVRAFFNRVREAIDGRGNDKLVTVGDLINGGIAVPGPGGTIIPPGGGVVNTPPAPTNVVATGAIQNIIVEWDDPRYYGHAYAEVWGSSTDNLGTAVLLGMTPGAIYIDSVGPGVIRYYWVRFVNILDTAGPYNAVAGIKGETGPAVEYLLETLTGAITETQLFDELGSRIDLVDQTNGGLINKYVVKVDSNGYVSGFGLASATNNGATVSNFIIRADRFSIASPTGPGITPLIPFIVTTTPQTINGVAVPVGVFINGAFIQNGTITNAKIGNAAIDDAKIASLSAGKITAGSISVGSYIQSANYILGSQGWKIHGDGTAEFGAAAIRGQLTAAQINSNGLSIRDTSGNIILNAGTGAFLGNVAGTVAGTSATTLVSTSNTALSTSNTALSTANTALTTANSAQTTANSATLELTTKLDNDARNVLAGFGGLAAGTLNWNSSGVRTSGYGVALTANGLAAYNTSGAVTFSVNASTGNATFAGELSAASGTFAGTLTASAINAVNTINIAGQAVTIPSASTGSGTGASVTININASYPIVIIATFNGAYIAEASFSILRNGSPIMITSSNSSGGVTPYFPVTVATVDNPPAGSVTYTISSTKSVVDSFIFVLAAKR